MSSTANVPDEPDNYDSLKGDQLVGLLRERGLTITGVKKTRIYLLRQYDREERQRRLDAAEAINTIQQAALRKAEARREKEEKLRKLTTPFTRNDEDIRAEFAAAQASYEKAVAKIEADAAVATNQAAERKDAVDRDIYNRLALKNERRLAEANALKRELEEDTLTSEVQMEEPSSTRNDEQTSRQEIPNEPTSEVRTAEPSCRNDEQNSRQEAPEEPVMSERRREKQPMREMAQETGRPESRKETQPMSQESQEDSDDDLPLASVSFMAKQNQAASGSTAHSASRGNSTPSTATRYSAIRKNSVADTSTEHRASTPKPGPSRKRTTSDRSPLQATTSKRAKSSGALGNQASSSRVNGAAVIMFDLTDEPAELTPSEITPRPTQKKNVSSSSTPKEDVSLRQAASSSSSRAMTPNPASASRPTPKPSRPRATSASRVEALKKDRGEGSSRLSPLNPARRTSTNEAMPPPPRPPVSAFADDRRPPNPLSALVDNRTSTSPSRSASTSTISRKCARKSQPEKIRELGQSTRTLDSNAQSAPKQKSRQSQQRGESSRGDRPSPARSPVEKDVRSTLTPGIHFLYISSEHVPATNQLARFLYLKFSDFAENVRVDETGHFVLFREHNTARLSRECYDKWNGETVTLERVDYKLVMEKDFILR